MKTEEANKKRLLFVTRALIAPPHAGCMIRAVNIARQLEKSYEVTMLAVSREFDAESVRFCQETFKRFERVQLKPYSDYPAPFAEILRKWHMHWPPSRGTQARPSDQRLFQKLVGQNDAVWFHTMGAAMPFKFDRLPASVMDLDDLNQCKYAQHATLQPTLRLRLSARIQAFKWKKSEQAAFSRFDQVVVCSQDDKTFLKGGDETSVIPNGYVQPEQSPQWTEPDPLRIGFIGLLAYGPNRDGLVWFRDHVWPFIRQKQPGMRLRIIGKLPAEKDYVRADGFEYTGFLPDTAEEMKSWSSLIVPIPYGGGTRIKILDAFSKMCPVVATPIGAHGICAENEKHLLLADDPKAFAGHCLRLAQQPELGRSLADAAWQLFDEKYTWDVIGRSIRETAQKAISQKAPHG